MGAGSPADIGACGVRLDICPAEQPVTARAMVNAPAALTRVRLLLQVVRVVSVVVVLIVVVGLFMAISLA
jgi:hypothetical protein